MLKISWTSKIPNQKVLQLAKSKRMWKKLITEKKTEYFGHIIRAQRIQILTIYNPKEN